MKGCIRGSAHIGCLNLRPPERMLPTIRAMYRCPAHAKKGKVDDSVTATCNNNETAFIATKKGIFKLSRFMLFILK